MKHKVTCRYGVTYEVNAKGTAGAQSRLVHMLSACCCWVCANHFCESPKNEKFDGCLKYCELYTKRPFCKEKEDEL